MIFYATTIQLITSMQSTGHMILTYEQTSLIAAYAISAVFSSLA